MSAFYMESMIAGFKDRTALCSIVSGLGLEMKFSGRTDAQSCKA